MKHPIRRLSLAGLCGVLLAAGLRAEDGLPPFTADRLHASDLQAAAAAVAPPVYLDRKNQIESDELDAQGHPRPVGNPKRPFSDSRLSPVYQSWMSFYENGAAAPKDVRDEWTLVAAVQFNAWEHCSGFLFKRCQAYRKAMVSTDPEGWPYYGSLDGQKLTLKFTEQTVTVRDIIFANREKAYPYSKGEDSLRFHDDQPGLFWSCRSFKNDDSKMICEAHSADGDWYERHTFFLVYSRSDSMDSLETMGALLTPFVPQAPQLRLIRSRPKD